MNPALIPCEECDSDLGHSYAYTVPRHRSSRDLFVEQVRLDGTVSLYGPAVGQ